MQSLSCQNCSPKWGAFLQASAVVAAPNTQQHAQQPWSRTARGPPRPRTRYQGPHLLALLVPPLERQAEVIVPQCAAHIDVRASNMIGRAVNAYSLQAPPNVKGASMLAGACKGGGGLWQWLHDVAGCQPGAPEAEDTSACRPQWLPAGPRFAS